jgi:4'-phosphopantetheinyl transferase EntD
VEPIDRSPVNEIDRALRALTDRVLADRARRPGAGTVSVGARPIDAGDIEHLHPAERRAIARAVPKRQREFATGRALLRKLLDRDVAIPVAPDRSPRWPSGVVGSLAHDAEIAVAAVSSDPRIRAIGIDVEPATALKPEIARIVLRDDEAGLDAHLTFALKEAAYKAWSALGGHLLDHHDVRIRRSGSDVDRPADIRPFEADVIGTATTLDGASITCAGWHLALVIVTSDQGRPQHT